MAKRPQRARSAPRRTRVPRAEGIRTGLDDPAVIDLVARNPQTHDVLLTVTVARPWEAADNDRLKKKIAAYLEHVTSDGLAAAMPDWHQGTVTIGVHAAEPPPAAFEPLWERYAYTLRHQFGLGFEMKVLLGANQSETIIEAPGHAGTDAAGAMRGGWAFASYVAEALQGSGRYDVVAVLDASALRTEQGGHDTTISLENLWRRCKGQGADVLTREVAAFVDGASEAQEDTPEEAAAHILPVMRPIERMHKIRALQQQHGALAPAEIHEPFSREIVLSYVVDRESTMQSLAPDEAKAYAASWEDLHNLAVSNLWERARSQTQVHTLEEGIFMVAAGGEYEAGLLCLAPLWRKLAGTVQGEVIAAVPAADLLLFTGSANAQAVQALRLRANELHGTANHAVSPGLLRLTPQGWVDA